MQNIKEPLKDLIDLAEKNLYSINKVEWWLLKYSNLYLKCYDYVHSQHIFIKDDGSKIRLPPFGEPSDEEVFLKTYLALEKISEFHRNEKYFEQEIVEYDRIKYSRSALNKWIKKNKYLGAKKYVCFILDYLDYSEDANHLHINVQASNELEIYINRKDFKNTITFLERFNDLYWTD